MPFWKCSMILKVGTGNNRVGGWSENMYESTSDLSVLQNSFLRRCELRARLLPATGSITGQRYQQVEPRGATIATNRIYRGVETWPTDAPQMALYLRIPAAGVPASRQYHLPGIPDQFIVLGEYAPSAQFSAALNAYIDSLSGYRLKAEDKDQVAYDIESITEGGVLTTTQATVWAQGQRVKLLRVVNQYGQAVRGSYVLSALGSSARVWTLAGYAGGAVGSVGRVRRLVVVYPTMAPPEPPLTPLATTRKVGRPSDQFRGRRSRRRR